MFKNILLATDGSTSAESATKLAIKLANQHGAKLVALYVVDPYPYLGIGEANPAGFTAYIQAANAHAAKVHNDVLNLARQSAPSVKVECLLVEDTAASVGIVETSSNQNCDLIVIGSHGRNGIGRLVLGSVANKVVNESRVPVLVAR